MSLLKESHEPEKLSAPPIPLHIRLERAFGGSVRNATVGLASGDSVLGDRIGTLGHFP